MTKIDKKINNFFPEEEFKDLQRKKGKKEEMKSAISKQNSYDDFEIEPDPESDEVESDKKREFLNKPKDIESSYGNSSQQNLSRVNVTKISGNKDKPKATRLENIKKLKKILGQIAPKIDEGFSLDYLGEKNVKKNRKITQKKMGNFLQLERIKIP